MSKHPEDEPGKEAGKENSPLGESAFTPEQRHALERKGYFIYRLTGQSITTLRDAGHPFWSNLSGSTRFKIETISSLHTEVAINPQRLFLPNSNKRTMDVQLAMVAEFSEEIGREVHGTVAILGNDSDYAEVVFAHFTHTRQLLFEAKDAFDISNYTRTTTRIGGPSFVIVGGLDKNHGLFVSRMDCDEGRGNVWAAPLVVPA